jgi:hypothetical protein
MKALLIALFALLAATAYAEDCETTVSQSPAYSGVIKVMETVYADASWIEKEIVLYGYKLEIEAVCDVKLKRGKQSRYWSLPGVITDEDYFKTIIGFYGL